MKEIIGFLYENPSGAFATVDNGKARVRPWGFMLEESGMFYFCTANTKDVYKQLQQVPFAEFTSTSKDMVTVRLSGKVIFTDDVSMKRKVLENNPMVKSIYQSEDNPIFEVFYIEHGEAIISDFSGQPPRKFTF
ncbi:pyridoxamine 5'-phosphate oxidase family protein [Geosporobacter ferrireducens]|uniref:Pyridoxamine 5'-phosphate oxidase n=1 Tax=Geosporobacter ferrireducens TaxID=1424294 RepID=A0A1D8GJ88_9FIRM|nr:pyridoxamine 5'-phosphate oxidase family protein [Geosporobacter ferrireducens]AOT70988.1 pyridoxamine 5'-phosphate oxidase [Geosporobacter ferrireducens]MTI53705.1 pyridoxamine 5'-phosphate oxidase [Geosporobacter ferrireducens]